MLIWTNFNSSAFIISNISSLLQKFHFPIEVVLNSLHTQKGLELVFMSQFLYNFLINFSFCNIWPIFIKTLLFTSQVIQLNTFLFYA